MPYLFTPFLPPPHVGAMESGERFIVFFALIFFFYGLLVLFGDSSKPDKKD